MSIFNEEQIKAMFIVLTGEIFSDFYNSFYEKPKL